MTHTLAVNSCQHTVEISSRLKPVFTIRTDLPAPRASRLLLIRGIGKHNTPTSGRGDWQHEEAKSEREGTGYIYM